MIYIQKETGFMDTADTLPASYETGDTWVAYTTGAYVPLDDTRKAYHRENPGLTPEEVWHMATPVIDTAALLDRERRIKIAEIEEYDSGEKVNGFYVTVINGEEATTLRMWLDKPTRTSLVSNTIPAERAKGRTETTLWYEGEPPVSIPVTLDWMEEALRKLELYAKDTYDVTQRHIAAIYSITEMADIEGYNHKEGYPAMLSFNIVVGV